MQRDTCTHSVCAADEAWALTQFSSADLSDQRLDKRLVKLAGAMAATPNEPLPKQCPDWSDLMGAYRFLNNPRVDPHEIQQTHRRLTREACAQHPVVLCLEDTSELDFTDHPSTKGLGPIGGGQGTLQHSALAVLPDGTVLGLLDSRWHNRVAAPKGETRRQRLMRWRESNFWAEAIHAIGAAPASDVGTRFIDTTDRGGDCFDTMQASEDEGHGFVIRAQHHRRVNGGTDELWSFMQKQPVVAKPKVEVPARKGHILQPARKARRATVVIRMAPVTLEPPQQDPRHKQPKAVWAVYAQESNPPQEEGAEPIDWMLLTSEPVQSVSDAVKILRWYEKRWRIEEWHRALKEGCALEKSQLDCVEDLQRLASINGVIAVRLLQLRDLADMANAGEALEDNPDDQAVMASQADSPEALQQMVPWLWIMVVCHLAKKKNPSKLTPREFWRAIAKRGGWLGRKCDGRPGWKTIWRGWHEIMLLIHGAKIQQALAEPSKCV